MNTERTDRPCFSLQETKNLACSDDMALVENVSGSGDASLLLIVSSNYP